MLGLLIGHLPSEESFDWRFAVGPRHCSDLPVIFTNFPLVGRDALIETSLWASGQLIPRVSRHSSSTGDSISLK